MKMQPKSQFITIKNNERLILEFVRDMLIQPRIIAHKWSEVTNQTPNLKIGYPAQHLASLITGMRGNATGARGNDIIDGSEVKGCSLVDQSDKCRNCGSNVLRSETVCGFCDSSDIKRNKDSKWLISVRSEDELAMLVNETPRFIFIVTDYSYFIENNFDDIRIRAFEVWVRSPRCNKFIELLDNYYHYIYLMHKKKDPNKNPAPKNLFPDNYPFYMCNPIKVFQCDITDSLSKIPKIEITHYIEPAEDRTNIESEKMPVKILSRREKELLLSNGIDLKNVEFIDEKLRSYLDLRDSDKTIKHIGQKKHKALIPLRN